MAVLYVRAHLELARGRDQDVLATFEAAERLSRLLDAPEWPLMRTRALRLHALVRLGETGRAERDIADISEQGRASGDIRLATAALRIAQGDSRAATVALAPVLSGAASVPPTTWLSHAYVLEAIARNALGDPAAADHAMRRALDIATADGAVTAFLFHPPARELFDRHAPDPSQRSPLVAEIRTRLPQPRKNQRGKGDPGGLGDQSNPERFDGPESQGRPPSRGTQGGSGGRAVPPSARGVRGGLLPPGKSFSPGIMSQSEIRVLHYLPTNLSAAEIAQELSISVTTVARTSATYFSSSACTVAPKRSCRPAPSACSRHHPNDRRTTPPAKAC
jgi:LuxR family transcriptional regulator, maltose regulon positive regulatory protein